MYLPFGYRFEDDNAFVRQLSGINMQAPDEGVEFGFEKGAWSTQLAISNGTGGAPEVDDGKQIIARTEYVQSAWRVGASALFNDTDAGDRTGRRRVRRRVALGPVTLLGEVDYIDDDSIGVDGRKLMASLVEADWKVRAGPQPQAHLRVVRARRRRRRGRADAHQPAVRVVADPVRPAARRRAHLRRHSAERSARTASRRSCSCMDSSRPRPHSKRWGMQASPFDDTGGGLRPELHALGLRHRVARAGVGAAAGGVRRRASASSSSAAAPGEDAVHLARAGHRVFATDASDEMIRIARLKAVAAGCADRIEFACHADGSRCTRCRAERALRRRVLQLRRHQLRRRCSARRAHALAPRLAPRRAAGVRRHGPPRALGVGLVPRARRSAPRIPPPARGGVAWRGLTIHYPTPAQLARVAGAAFRRRGGARRWDSRCRRVMPRGWLDRAPRTLAALTRHRARAAALDGRRSPITSCSRRCARAPRSIRTDARAAARHAVSDRALQLALRHLRLLAARPRGRDARVGRADAAGARALGTRTALLSGGEPLLNPRMARRSPALLRAPRHRSVAAHLGSVARQTRARAARRCSSRSPFRSTAPAPRPTRRSAVSMPSTRSARAFARRWRAGAAVGLRVTLQRANYRELPRFVTLARELGVAQVSFLAVDVSNPHAFARRDDVRRRAWRSRADDLPRARCADRCARARVTPRISAAASSPNRRRSCAACATTSRRCAGRAISRPCAAMRRSSPRWSASTAACRRVSSFPARAPQPGAGSARRARRARAMVRAARAPFAPASGPNARAACARCIATPARARRRGFAAEGACRRLSSPLQLLGRPAPGSAAQRARPRADRASTV